MSQIGDAELEFYSKKPSSIRNFCVVAHVDHGKTTLSDYLVASNGILSQQLAGEVRLMDSRPDEQERCITMKASSIALQHVHLGTPHLLNLVDSPGHIDFSCEVSTAMRLCDGAVIVVDVVDGVRQQTYSMLRHAYRERLSMMLVLNKIDRFIVTQQCTPAEAYDRMRSIVETCNATLAACANQERIQRVGEEEGKCSASPLDVTPSSSSSPVPQGEDGTSVEVKDEEEDQEETWFDPVKKNVVFCSCKDGWAFQLRDFAKLYSNILPDVKNLENYLWGEYYFDAKTRTATSTKRKSSQQPLAVQLVLEPLWAMYNAFSEKGEEAERRRMAGKVGVEEKRWNTSRFHDNNSKLKAVLSAWLPLAPCVLETVCETLDNPMEAVQRRLDALLPGHEALEEKVKQAILTCDASGDAPCVAYVCKLIDTQYLVGGMIGEGAESRAANDDSGFIGFARVYSGQLRAEEKVYVYSHGRMEENTVSKVFMFRGAGLEAVATVYAGSLCGIGGLTRSIVKYGTVSSIQNAAPFQPLALPSSSIVRFSVYPKNPKDLPQLERGLRLLYKIDPQVELSVAPTGELVIGTAGEVHAERCLKDLVDTFSQVEVVASEPIVCFRETIIGSSKTKANKPYTASILDGAFSITISARPLPSEALEILSEDQENISGNPRVRQQLETVLRQHRRYASIWKKERKRGNGLYADGPTKLGFIGSVLLIDLDEDRVGGKEMEDGGMNSGGIERGENINGTVGSIAAPGTNKHSSDNTGKNASMEEQEGTGVEGTSSSQRHQLQLLQDWKEWIVAGFQAAAESGPMAQEPLFGIAFIISRIEMHPLPDGSWVSGGSVLPCVRDACRAAMEVHPRRLVEPLLDCTVYSSGPTQGKIYAALNRRRSEIVEEVLTEGSDLFYIKCFLPAVEAFGLQDELRIQTQGASNAQLQMSRWTIIEADPFFVPTTKEELEEYGKEVGTKNIGARLLEKIQRRKGLYREKVVQNAEKQKFSLKGA